MANPWDDNWVEVGRLGKGGQGLTYRVYRKGRSEEVGVLKKLKNNQDVEARRRMFQEVANLRVLASAEVKVPKVLAGGDNTDKYEDASIQLYFVMEYIPGKSLEQEIEARGHLSIEQSIALVVDLSSAMAQAHENKVLHRDLKPANIIVRSLDEANAVIIDLGLSFNKDQHQSVTTTSEAFSNEFFHLPENESRDPELRRDPRSDVAALVGVLYYCLTGHKPLQPRDPNGLGPHRRPGRTVRESHAADHRCYAIEQILDRGFAHEIENRFRTVNEFVLRLKGIMAMSTESAVDLGAIIDQVDTQFRQVDRPTQLQEFARHNQAIAGAIAQHLERRWQAHNQRGPYGLGILIGRQVNLQLPTGIDPLPVDWFISVSLKPHGHARVIHYTVGADGPECVLFQSTRTQLSGRQPSNPTPCQEILRYNPASPPSPQVLEPLIEKAVAETMRQLANDARPGTF
jgi:serine/threonine protein kinase